MKHFLLPFILFTISVLLFSSCLTTEKKEYSFEFTGENSGVLTIKYINIMSVSKDESELETDFDHLINNYLEGDNVETHYKFARLISKRLFEENGVLCGEVKFEFSEPAAVRLFKYAKGPYMMYLGGNSGDEHFESANGDFGGDIMPVVFWSDELKHLELTTNITRPDQNSTGLLEKYKEWEASKAQ